MVRTYQERCLAFACGCRQCPPLPFFWMKDLRSTAGTDAADEQFSEFNVAGFLEHADSKVTAKHYIKRKLDAKRQIAEALASKLNIA